MDYRKSEKYIEANESLSDELKPIYEEFVADYRYSATIPSGKPYVSYIVLAGMIKAGWRLTQGTKNQQD